MDVHTATTDLDSLRGLLAAGQFSLLHFASHNSFSRKPPFNKITLAKRRVRPELPESVQAASPPSEPSSPLVFINACGSDRRTPIYTHLGGWADAFINAAQAHSSDHCGRSAIQSSHELRHRALHGPNPRRDHR